MDTVDGESDVEIEIVSGKSDPCRIKLDRGTMELNVGGKNIPLDHATSLIVEFRIARVPKIIIERTQPVIWKDHVG